MSRIVVCSFPTEQATQPPDERDWTREAVWEDGEWVEGEPIIHRSIEGDELTAEELKRRLDGPTVIAFDADSAPA